MTQPHQPRHSTMHMTSPTGQRINPRSGTVKLGPKQLREQILGVLAAEPDRVFTLSDIRTAIQRNNGAVPLAVRKLVELGQAVKISGGYRFAAATATMPAPTPVAMPPAAPSKPGPIQRPGGDWYHPRALAGGADIDVLRKLRAAELPVLLYGPPGTGKTSLLEAAFPDLVTLAGDEDTTVGDLVGDYVPDGAGGYKWADGPLTVAMSTGAVLLVDDATLISPKVLASLYPAMDGRKQVILKAHGGRLVQAVPGFYVVAGHNPGVAGAILSEPLASRFTAHIEVSTDHDLAIKLGVDRRIVAAARALTAKVKTGEIGWAPQMRELLGATRLAAQIGIDNAVANLIGIAPPEDRDTVIAELKTAMKTTPPSPLAIGRQL